MNTRLQIGSTDEGLTKRKYLYRAFKDATQSML